ncbi:MAG: pyridoxamine 5'-phosphate oxidase family protein [Ignavibacteriales bacterium]
MRRKDRLIEKKSELLQILDEGTSCQIAFIDKNEPYIVTLNFGYDWSADELKLFFHSAKEGRKISLIRDNPRVCFTIVVEGELITGKKACDFSMTYKSIVGYGIIKIIHDKKEKRISLNKLMEKYTKKNDWEFQESLLNNTEIYSLEVQEITGKTKK